MVGDDPHGHLVGVALVRPPGLFGNGGDDRGEHVDVVVGTLALQDGANTFKSHSRVDMFRGEGFQLAVLIPVVLDEDQIPDFHHPRIARIHQSAARAVGRQINVDLGARTARTGIAHLPEIVFLAEPQDMRGIDVRLLAPEILGLAVGLENGGVQPCFVKSPHSR